MNSDQNLSKISNQELFKELEKRIKMKINNCQAFLSQGKLCHQPLDPACQEWQITQQCLKHCPGQNYPKSSYLRCKNPNHPPYKKVKTPAWTYQNNQDITTLSKIKLKSHIEKDLELLEELKKEIESTYLPNDDTETWDADSTSELLETIEKMKTVLETENGLQDKLELWNNFQENEESEDDYD